VLARKIAARYPPRSARDARLALSGIACGTLPFLGFTMIRKARRTPTSRPDT